MRKPGFATLAAAALLAALALPTPADAAVDDRGASGLAARMAQALRTLASAFGVGPEQATTPPAAMTSDVDPDGTPQQQAATPPAAMTADGDPDG